VDALIGEGEGVFRTDDGLAAMATRHLERALLPIGVDVEGPAIVFQRDTTILVPPGWRACAHDSGNLIVAR
jgi:N-methylhydantoinase A